MSFWAEPSLYMYSGCEAADLTPCPLPTPCLSLPSSPRDRCRVAPEYFTAQKMKKAYYLTQKIPDQVGDCLYPSASRKLPWSNLWGPEANSSSSLSGRISYIPTCKDLLACMSLERTSVVAQMVKRLPTTQETWVQSLGWEGLLEKEVTTHSTILAWKIPWTEEPGRLQSMGSQRVGHD